MAKGIYNNAYLYGPKGLGKKLMVDHIKKTLNVEGYLNGTIKVLKMDKSQASYLRGIYEALDLLSNLWATAKDEEFGTAMITNLISDEWFADYIVDHFAVKQRLFPTTYKEMYEEAENEGSIIEVK